MLSWFKNCEAKSRDGAMTRAVKLPLATPLLADERRGRAWWSSAFAAVMASAGLTLLLDPQTLWRPVMSLSLALVAAGYAIFIGERKRSVPINGLLGMWWFLFAVPLVYSGPLDGVGAKIEHLSGINAAVAALIFSFTFQGPRTLFFVAQSVLITLAFGAAVGDPRDFWLKTSAALFVASFAVYFLRVSRTREALTLDRLEASRDRALALRGKISDLVDSSEAARERLLGPLTRGLSFYSVKSSQESLGFGGRSQGPVLTIETLVSEARRSLLQFQKDWVIKASAGPVRFVFFPPVTGTDMSALVAGDVTTLVAGIGTCLNLALESLPEAGPRRERREGVVRLSIRVGLRVVEIAVEDNGRGTLGVVGATELVEKLTGLRRFAESHGGKLERFARLGVGARTVIELPLRVAARDIKYGILPVTEFDPASEEATATAPHA